jgi:hypothetical protein
MMRIRSKVKALLPKIAEAIIAIEIHSLKDTKAGRSPLSMYVVLKSILFVLTEGLQLESCRSATGRLNSVYQYFRRWCHLTDLVSH